MLLCGGVEGQIVRWFDKSYAIHADFSKYWKGNEENKRGDILQAGQISPQNGSISEALQDFMSSKQLHR